MKTPAKPGRDLDANTDRAICRDMRLRQPPISARVLAIVMAAAVIAAPAQAWQAGVDGRLCTLTHAEPGLQLRIDHDPIGPVYSLALTRDAPWPRAAVFGLRFAGMRPLTITTDRHRLSHGDRTLTVTDSGFGNVLDGIAFNSIAQAVTGDAVTALDLTGAAAEVATFRACTVAPSA